MLAIGREWIGVRAPRCAAALLAIALMVPVTAPAPVNAQVSPEESAKKLKPAPGLKATLWASEPMVLNPTTMDVDSRGRVWVTEGLNYRLYRNTNASIGLKDEADRVKILEDTDGDGKADKVTVFADKIFPVPMGIAVEEHHDKQGKYTGCRVFIGNSPNLLVLEDTDGDDKADKRYPLLSGFGGVDSDHGVHGMTLGLDGKLYFTHGDGCCSVQPDKSQKTQNFNVTDKSGRKVIGTNLATTLRVNRDGTQFEILADRQRNNYETCLNSWGNIFTSDNDDDGNRGSRVIWVMEGGTYGYRTPGSPRHWGEDVPGNVPKLVGTGNGSPCGIMAYEGTLLKDFADTLFEAEAGTRQINAFPVTRAGAAFRTEAKVLLASDDPWFRPVDMTAAPDGSVFVADWYDAGVGGHAFRDQTTGRIYRVAPQSETAVKFPRPDFSTVEGAIQALASPVVATQDAARSVLIARADAAVPVLKRRLAGAEPHLRARALWVLHAIEGDAAALETLRDADPRLREQAVRILGRDVQTMGDIEEPQGKTVAPLASKNVDALIPLAADPDAGVRREVILALREMPTAKVGEALRSLVVGWDGQDRWYLEALGLALQNREAAFLTELFERNPFGELGLPEAGRVEPLALPPYFPVDRNEAFLSLADTSPPANALSKTLGLAWRLRRAEVLPMLARVMPNLETTDLREAADDVLAQIRDPKAVETLVGLVESASSASRKKQYLAMIARQLDGPWSAARSQPSVVRLITESLARAELRREGIDLAAASADGRHAAALRSLIVDGKIAEEERVAAVQALGQIRATGARAFLLEQLEQAKVAKSSNPVAEAAVRTLPRLGGEARQTLAGLVQDLAWPSALRREAVRTLTQMQNGPQQLIALARDAKLPNDLKVEATTALYAHPDRDIRDAAAKVLPPPVSASGRPLPPLGELIRREGNADRGRVVFHRAGSNGCATCHRVQGHGQWIGPDLSTIGTKYGKDELLRSILNPSAAIGYNYRTQVLALNDGRAVSGLVVEESPTELMIKTSEGRRIRVKTSEIDERTTSDISLMPEGLAQSLQVQEIADVLAYLSTLKQPVSVVGQYHGAGPLADGAEPKSKLERLSANAEGQVNLANLAGNAADKAALLEVRVVSPGAASTPSRVVFDARGELRAWWNDKPLSLTTSGDDPSRFANVELKPGENLLKIRVSGGTDPSLVTTFVADRPVEFR